MTESATYTGRVSTLWQYGYARLRRLTAQMSQLPRALSLVWESARRLTAAWVALLVTQGLLPLATVYLTRPLVNQLIRAVRSHGDSRDIRLTLVLAAWMGAVMIAGQLLRSMTAWVRTAQSEKVKDHVTGLIHQKSVEVDLAFYDSSDFFDHLHRARMEASYRPTDLIDTLGALLQNGITAVALIAVLIPFGPILPLALLVSALPILYVTLKRGQRRHQWNQTATVEERRSWYYDAVLTNADSAAEIRLFGLGRYFRNAYQGIRSHLREQRGIIARREAFDELWAGLAALGILGATVLWTVWRALRGLISIGDLALFYQAFNQGIGVARTSLENVGHLYENTLFLGNLFEFLDFSPRVISPSQVVPVSDSLVSGIRFENVTFHYPGSEKPVLKKFSIDIGSGTVVALVGPNGAGKSTLVKLLCRFYDPDNGVITIDGVPLPQIAVERLRRLLTVQFQGPVQYNTTARENIRFGDIDRGGPDARIGAEQAARSAGADEFLEALPEGYDTQLGRWFISGNELSAGQWQRVGLARAFYRTAPIILLDEPTSAMDPWAEIEWGRRFRKFAANRTGIIITHRFTTAMFADTIHVLADGELIESGSHEQLLRRGGLYSKGWSAQSYAGTSL
jgi:ATP-binding cassette subfamily B protein